MRKTIWPTFLQAAALALACLCLHMLYQMHLHPILVGVPDALTPNEVKALLGLCGWYLFGSTAGSQNKDTAHAAQISALTEKLANSVPASAIPDAISPVVNVHNVVPVQPPAPTLQAVDTATGPIITNIPEVNKMGNLTHGE